jgi:hypothetical protein
MTASGLWYCHSCEHTAPSLPAARRHAKDSGPVYRNGKAMRHLLTRDETAAIVDREAAK